jgi:isoleucyl-tRNA synthetase
VTTAKVLAPFAPFLAEHLYQELKRWMAKHKDSVHLESWPRAHREFTDEALLKEQALMREIVERGLAKRAELKIKVRQPLGAVFVGGARETTPASRAVVIEELNVKEWRDVDAPSGQLTVDLDPTLSGDLKREGLQRELVRQINALRKKQGLTINDLVIVRYATDSAALQQVLASEAAAVARAVLASRLEAGAGEHELKVDGETIVVTLVR